ncbi:MAG: hypothetical protein ACYS76_09750 [Planctomycetota bacterium]|jgi:hypothetical protein
MKRWNLALVEFMKKKKEILLKAGIESAQEYTDKQIEKDLMSWDEERAKNIYYILVHNIFPYKTRYGAYGIGRNLCPYCIDIIKRKCICRDCFYGKKKRICTENSIWRNIFIEMKGKNIEIGSILTNDVYKDLIKMINKKYKLEIIIGGNK